MSEMYVVPSGDGQGQSIEIDITAIVKAESRLRDVAIVNEGNAAELLSTFNEHWLTCQQLVARLSSEKIKADDAAKRAYSEAILDCTDEKFKARGHGKASADLRDAMACVDVRVQAAKDRALHIRTVLEHIAAKGKAFENAFTSVKRLVSGLQARPTPLNHGHYSVVEDYDAFMRKNSQHE